MKKTLWLALILLLVCMFTFSACDIGNQPSKPDNTQSETADDSTESEDRPSQDEKLSAEEIYEKVSPSVVVITAESPSATNSGTGFFYKDGSTIVTNYHVIENCSSASITLTNGKEYDVLTVLGYDEEKDIAILKVDYRNGTPLEIRATGVKTGESVFAIGNSLGFLDGSLSEGIISTAKREIDGQNYIQTTAAVTHGNSGGPLIDSYGKVIGIISAGFGDGLDLNLAIPVAEINTISTKNPTTLEEMFHQTVEWISNREFLYYEDEDTYVLLFGLADVNETPIKSSGTVNMQIVNADGVTVYNKSKHFTESSFENWISGGTDEYMLATIYIDPDEITKGSTEYGNIYFTVYGDDYYFDEYSLYVSDLPINTQSDSSNSNEETQTPDIPNTQKVTSLGNYSITMQDDNTKYVFSFVLNDQEGKPMSNSGQIEIKIVNDLGVTVYSNTRSFYKDDFQNIGSASDQKYQLSIFVDKKDIDTDFSSEGNFYFKISGSEFDFDEKSVTITELPSITVQSPQTPLYVNTISFNASSGSYGVSHTVRIDSFLYEIDMFGNLSIYCSGEKTYDIKGASSTHFCEMNWRLYDLDGYLIDYGWDTVSGLKVGDKFKDHKINITTINITAVESYRLEVFDSSYE